MIYYIHKFKVSSGLCRKVITKVYNTEGEAIEQFHLLGGKVYVVERVETWKA